MIQLTLIIKTHLTITLNFKDLEYRAPTKKFQGRVGFSE